MESKMKLLLTGFEPFGGSALNPSGQVARSLNNKTLKDLRVESVVLPVDRKRMPEKLVEILKKSEPDVVMGLGEAPRRAVISIERVAVNLEDYMIPDNRGKLATDLAINPDGPAAYFATLPIRQIYEALQKAAIPSELSLSAGAYLCNQMLYTLLETISTEGINIPAGFIHLPSLPEQVIGKSPQSASMSFELSQRAVIVAIETISVWMKRRRS
jgi:pyroglutamyl-peptidase